MWFGEPHPFPERGSPTRLSASGQQRYEGWSCIVWHLVMLLRGQRPHTLEIDFKTHYIELSGTSKLQIAASWWHRTKYWKTARKRDYSVYKKWETNNSSQYSVFVTNRKVYLANTNARVVHLNLRHTHAMRKE